MNEVEEEMVVEEGSVGESSVVTLYSYTHYYSY